METKLESMPLTAKGHVKLELYNENGTYLEKEKHNLVVQSANEIVASILADPAKIVTIDQVDKGETQLTAEAEGYPFDLMAQRIKRVTFKNDLGSSNAEKIITIEEMKEMTSLDRVILDGEVLEINKDVAVLDAKEGKIEFKVAPTAAFEVRGYVLNDAYSKAVESSAKVEVNHVAFTRSNKASDADKTFVFNADLGQVFFETPKEKVVVTYKYEMVNSLGFMSLGGKPTGWADKKPVTFNNSDKLKTDMGGAELPESRVRIQYPSTTETGAKEIDPSIPTIPVESALLSDTIRVGVQSDGETKVLEYDVTNVHINGAVRTNCIMLELRTVENMTTGVDLKSSTTIVKSDLTGITLKFDESLVSKDDFVKATYLVKVSNKHLTYQLAQAPAIRLINVRHIDSLDPTKISDYRIVKEGLQTGYGDVWISNPATGHIQFSETPTDGPVVETPGHLQVTYQINSGTTVKFVADFPKGVPGPVEMKTVYSKVLVAGEGGNVVLPKAIATDNLGNPKAIKVDMNGTQLQTSEYSITADNKTVVLNSVIAGKTLTIEYPYNEATHDIYQVAMFNVKSSGKMFNISGIGPITKDENTGMRITWSVTL